MASEKRISELLGRHLGVDFGTRKRSLDVWGQADRCIEIRENAWVLLEIEGKQHHPNTNVLKLWPFLKERKHLTVLLIHAFEKAGKNRVSTRGRLAEWLANEMTKLLRSRFNHRVVIDIASGAVEGAEGVAPLIKMLGKSRTSRSARSRVKRAPG